MDVNRPHSIKQQALQWANTFPVCCYLDSNNYTDPYTNFDILVAAGVSHQLTAATGQAFIKLQQFYNAHKSWMFGLLSYDLKNEIELLTPATQVDPLHFPDLFFFVPQYLVGIKDDILTVLLGDDSIRDTIQAMPLREPQSNAPITLQSRFEKAEYLNTIKVLQQHIRQGYIYEVNLCQEFFAEHAAIDPVSVYTQLNAHSPTPFSGYFKLNDKYILSASPERFLRKQGNRLISQPIKGTAKRSADRNQDEALKAQLRTSGKEQAENVMIVDLVRNDLTKSAVKGSVAVDELFGIYSFPQVHQLISTVSCKLRADVHPVTAIKNTFPMGSMTGAPKIKAMELITRYEKSKRGAYSGALGYFTPEGDFDFNVLIRSLFYQASSQYLSFQVGGAITHQSVPEQEYEECLLKATAMRNVLQTAQKSD